MKTLLRNSVGRHARSLAAFACLLAVAMQVALPVLHPVHGGHELSLSSMVPQAGTLASADGHAADEASHEPATCPQCRAVSQFGSPAVRFSSAAAPGFAAGRVPDGAVGLARSDRSGHEGPPRAPPLFS